jgi:hypothetical protein
MSTVASPSRVRSLRFWSFTNGRCAVGRFLFFCLLFLVTGAAMLGPACTSAECTLGEVRPCAGGTQSCERCLLGDDPRCVDPDHYGVPMWTECRKPTPSKPRIDPSWTCGAALWGDGFECDCGCGAVDPDCKGTTPDVCSTCLLKGSCVCSTSDGCPSVACSLLLDPLNNAICRKPSPEDSNSACANGIDDDLDGLIDCADPDCLGHDTCPPTTWHCGPTLYDDGFRCDCGCGIQDPDCADATLASCTVCDEIGGCNAAVCPGTIDPTNNSTCTMSGG